MVGPALGLRDSGTPRNNAGPYQRLTEHSDSVNSVAPRTVTGRIIECQCARETNSLCGLLKCSLYEEKKTTTAVRSHCFRIGFRSPCRARDRQYTLVIVRLSGYSECPHAGIPPLHIQTTSIKSHQSVSVEHCKPELSVDSRVVELRLSERISQLRYRLPLLLSSKMGSSAFWHLKLNEKCS
jgi:hypothetical protein